MVFVEEVRVLRRFLGGRSGLMTWIRCQAFFIQWNFSFLPQTCVVIYGSAVSMEEEQEKRVLK